MAEVKLMSQAEYAKHRGCSAVAVHKAVRAGRISLIGDKIDPKVADIQWAQNTRARTRNVTSTPQATAPAADLVSAADSAPGAAAADKPAPVDPGYNTHRAKREKADAEIAAMNAAKMAGELVVREDVDRAIFEIGRELRDRLASCARRMAAEVSSVATAEACEEVIEREHRIVLELLVTSCREKLGSAPRAAS